MLNLSNRKFANTLLLLSMFILLVGCKEEAGPSILSAPFDAVIAAHHVEPFQEVKRGQPIYEIFMEGAMEVVIDIPETVIGNIYFDLRYDSLINTIR